MGREKAFGWRFSFFTYWGSSRNWRGGAEMRYSRIDAQRRRRACRKISNFTAGTASGIVARQAAAMGLWFVPLGPVLDAHGLHAIKPFAFAASALAAFVSPLIFGAMTDRHTSPVKVLRGLALAAAAALALVSTAIKMNGHPWLVLALIQLYSLCSAPMWSISSTIVLARLEDAQKEFGPLRAMATIGWMTGCLLVSLLNADTSSLAGYTGAVTWLM